MKYVLLNVAWKSPKAVFVMLYECTISQNKIINMTLSHDDLLFISPTPRSPTVFQKHCIIGSGRPNRVLS